MRGSAACTASPSLALLKYWGKRTPSRNIPATPSLAVSLGALVTETSVLIDGSSSTDRDSVTVNGAPLPAERARRFFDEARRLTRMEVRFHAESRNNFPTSAGLASSSSGFAALAHACLRAAGQTPADRKVSGLARIGSTSAARAVYGGFTLLPAGATVARPLYDEGHWPDLRILIVTVTEDEKERSSREAMDISRRSSPFYRAWVRTAKRSLPDALDALAARDLQQLGEAIRLSYLRMFGTMISANPPILYWRPETVDVLRECEEMRRAGVGVWETMDAGPQVKLLCGSSEVDVVAERLRRRTPKLQLIVSRVGAAPVNRVETA